MPATPADASVVPNHRQQKSGPASPATGSLQWQLPAAVGLLAFVVAFTGAWIPSFWDDEIATLSAARRTPAELFLLLESVDAVHGFYYLLMHGWTTMFGSSEEVMRLPSALAVALACSGTVVLGRTLGSARLGVVAGVVLAFLPRMVWAGTEARQSGFAALLAVVLTLLLIRAWRSNSVGAWAAYTGCAVLGVWMFMFFALAVASHAAVALVLRRRRLATLVSCAAAGLLAAPFLVHTLGQKAQVDWIQDRPLAQHLLTAAVKQYFYGDDRPTENLPPQWVLGFVLLLGVLETGLVLWGLWAVRLNKALRPAVLLGLAGVVVPMAGLLTVSLVAQPVYVARYLAFTAPAFALLVGLGIMHLPRRPAWVQPAAVAGLALCSLVPQLTIKSIINEPPDTERRMAQFLAGNAEPPAAMVYQHPYLRDMALAYPEQFSGLTDLSLAQSPSASGTLWGENTAVTADRLLGAGRIWFVGEGTGGAPYDFSSFDSAGCVRTGIYEFKRLTLIPYSCP